VILELLGESIVLLSVLVLDRFHLAENVLQKRIELGSHQLFEEYLVSGSFGT